MTTKFIGIKDFRQNMAAYAKKAQASKSVRYVVMNRNTPLFAVAPFDEGMSLESFFVEIEEARQEVKVGKVHSQDKVLEMFG